VRLGNLLELDFLLVWEAECQYETRPCGFIALAHGRTIVELGTIFSKVGWNILGLQTIGDWFY
jgi:hypothetical protein